MDESPKGAPVANKLEAKVQAGLITISAGSVCSFVFVIGWFYDFRVPSIFFVIDCLATFGGFLGLYAATPAIRDIAHGLRVIGHVDDDDDDDGGGGGGEGEDDGDNAPIDQRDANAGLYRLYIWGMSAAQLGLLGFLVLQTGGIVTSPYAPILATSLALAPYVMNGERSILWLGLVSLLYLSSRNLTCGPALICL